MKKWKNYRIVLFIMACILLNYGGKGLAEYFKLPLWMDSVGTSLAAYVGGPVCGAIVGATVNIMYGAIAPNAYIYMITNIAVGIIVGILAKKGMFKRAFLAFSLSIIVALSSTAISVPLNYFLYEGMTGNIWGDGVIHYLGEMGIHESICIFFGEFYIDLVDKVVSIFIVFFILVIRKRINSNQINKVGAAVLIVALLSGGILSPMIVFADETIGKNDSVMVMEEPKEDTYFNSYIQTVYNGMNGIPGGEVNDIAQTRDGMLWVGTYGGLYQYDGTKFTFMSQFDSVRNVNCLYTDEEGRLWIGTNDCGLSICANNEIVNVIDKQSGLTEDSVRSITKSTNGMFYVGTNGSLCVIALVDGMKVVSVIDELNYVRQLTSSPEGYVCAVTLEGELALLKDLEIIEKCNHNEAGDTYTSVYFDNKILYASTSADKIEKYIINDGKLELISTIECDEIEDINSMYMTEQEQLFICAENGIGYIDRNEKFNYINTNNFDNSIENMIVDYQGNLWFSSSRLGLLEMAESSFGEVYKRAGLEEEVVNAVIKWNDKYYFGTDSGIDIVDLQLTSKIEETVGDTLKNVRVRFFLVDKNNHLWIATSGQGVYEVYSDGTMNKFDAENGLISDKTRTIIEVDNDTIAVATDNGISYIKDGKVVSNIGNEEGLLTPKTLCLYKKNKMLYAGTDGGGIAVIEDGKVTDTIRKTDGLSSDVILRIKESPDGVGVYIVTSNGLNFMDNAGNVKQLNQFPYYNNYDIITAPDGSMWVTSSAGIYVVDKYSLVYNDKIDYELLDEKRGFRASLTANSWNYVDSDSNLFLCTDIGVVCVNMNEYSKQRTSYRISLENIVVDGVRIAVDKEDTNILGRNVVRIEFFPQVINFSTSNPYVRVWLEGFDSEPIIVPQSELESMVYTNLPSGEYTFHLAILDNKQERTIEEISYKFYKENEFYDNWWFSIYMFVVFFIIAAYLIWLLVGSQIDKNLKIQKKEFENLKLKQTADAALAAGEAKDKFLALMSHDIRTPINAILGMNEMILRDSKEDEIYEYATDIKKAGNTLLALVNMILDYSKIEEGKMEIIPVNYETRGLINNLINVIMERAKKKALEFRIDVDEKLPSELYGDDVRITQVVSNLLTNAVKYTEKGYISLVIEEQERTDENIKIYVEVKDSGIGIRQEDMGKLFESFQRLDEKRNRNIEGTGLGMSIVVNLLKLMNSELDVESEYGVGTKFSFVIEQKIVSNNPIGNIHSESQQIYDKVEEKHIKAPDARILIVDDSQMNLKVATKLLKINEINADTASSGEMAIELLKEKKYDIVFLDHMMPDMDGIETFEKIRKEQLVGTETKIIILTANAINGAKEQYIKIGFDDYLSKPIEVELLEAKLKKYLPKSVILDDFKEDIKNEEDISTKKTQSNELYDICKELDTEVGLKYCMGDMDFYNEVIKEYINGNKVDELVRCFNENDLHNYRILIHSVKSNSINVGAVTIAEHAKALELAVKENDISFVEKEHAPFIEEYKTLLDHLNKYLNQ